MKKGLKTLIAGIVLLALGIFAVPLTFVVPLINIESNEVQFIVPATFRTKVDEPAKYYLWNIYKTMHEGKKYNQSVDIPDGVQIQIADANGKPMELITDGASFSGNSISTYYNSIGYIDIESPGEITITVTGIKQPRVFSFSRSLFSENMTKLLGGLAACFLLVVVGGGLAIWGIIKLMSSNKKNNYTDEICPAPNSSSWQNP